MSNLVSNAVATLGLFGEAFILDAISRNKQTFLKHFKTILKPMNRVLFIIAILLIIMVALGGCKKETIVIVKEPCKSKDIHPDSLKNWFRQRLISGGK